MKLVLIGISVALLGGSSWLWYQLREANASCNSMVVSTYSSELHLARRLEQQLREGRAGDALAQLQDWRDTNVVALSWALDAPDWQRSPRPDVITRGEKAFRDEAVYRSAVGESEGRISAQATAVLAAYR